jgi:hypothetical protein
MRRFVQLQFLPPPLHHQLHPPPPQVRAYQRHRLILQSHPNSHVLRLDAQVCESTMKKTYGKLPQVEDLVKACAFTKAARTEWINRTRDGKAIAKQYQAEMKPLEAEAKAELDLKKQQEREAHAASGGGGGGATAASGSRHPPPPTPPPIASSSAPLPSPPVPPAASSSLPLLIEVTDGIYEVPGDAGCYWWPVLVKEGVLLPAAHLRLKTSRRDVLFIGCLKGRSITIRSGEGGSEVAKADRAVAGAGMGCACSAAACDAVTPSATTRCVSVIAA